MLNRVIGGADVVARIAVAALALALPMLTAPVTRADPVAGTPCTDTNKIVPSGAGEMICSIIGTSPTGRTTQWAPLNGKYETVVMGSSYGPPGSDGDFRYARSTNDYLVWCVRNSYAEIPTWILATP
jgi:hypothetical protein